MVGPLNQFLRILHLSKSSSGGATVYAESLSNGLEQLGFESELLHDENLKDESLTGQSIAHFFNRLQGRFYVEAQKKTFHPTNRFRELDLRSRLTGYDVIHIHEVANWMGLKNLFNDMPKSTPVIMSLHDLWPITGGCVVFNGCERYKTSCDNCPALGTPFNRLLANRQLQLKRQIYTRENLHFVANSRWTYNKMQQATSIGKNRSLSIIHPVVDHDNFNIGNSESARQLLNLPLDAFIVCAGAASVTDENKNIAEAIQAVSQIASERQTVLLIFGDGNLPVPQNMDVRFLGPIANRQNLANVYRASDVFLSTSKMETYGMTLIEAMACGTPVVAYRTGAIPHVVPDRKTGILVETGKVPAIADALRELRDDSILREELRNNGIQLVSKRNRIEKLLEQHVALYRQACDLPTSAENPQAITSNEESTVKSYR